MFIKTIALIKKCMNDEMFDTAAQLSYYLMLSFFPAVLLILSAISWGKMDTQAVYTFLKAMVPGASYELIRSTVDGVFSSVDWNLFSVGLVLTIYSSSRGVRCLMKGLNKAYNIKENRNIFKRIALSSIFMIGLVFMIIVSLFLVVLGGYIGKGIGNWMGTNRNYEILWNAYRLFFAVLGIFIVFLIIYYILPAKKINVLKVVPGAIVATIGWIGASMVFSYYVENISDYTAVYGGLGAVIIFMIWIYITALVILIGGEINSAMFWEKSLGIKNLDKEG